MDIRSIHFVPNLRCNLACSYCYVAAHHNASMPSLDNLKKVCLFLNSIDFMGLHIEGGEPFINKENVDCILETLKPTDETYFITNGMFLNEEYIKGCLAHGFRKFTISIDGTKSAHETHRGTGFDLIIENIKEIVKFDILTSISTVLSKESIQELVFLVDLLLPLGIQEFRLGDIVQVGRGAIRNESFILSEFDYKLLLGVLDTLINRRVKISLSLNPLRVPHFFEEGIEGLGFEIKKYGCSAAKSQFCIDGFGNIYPCYNILGIPSKEVINIFEHNITPETVLASIANSDIKKKCPYYSEENAHFYARYYPSRYC